MHCTYLLRSDGHVLNDTWLGHRRAYLAACIRLLRTQPKAFLGTLGSLDDCLLRDICGAFHSSQADHSYVLPEVVSYTIDIYLVPATSQFEPTLKLCIAVFPNWLVCHLPTKDELSPKSRYFIACNSLRLPHSRDSSSYHDNTQIPPRCSANSPCCDHKQVHP